MARDNILDDSPEDWACAAWRGNNTPAALVLIMRTAFRRDIPAIGFRFLFTIRDCKAWFRKRNSRVPISDAVRPPTVDILREEIRIHEGEPVEREMLAYPLLRWRQ